MIEPLLPALKKNPKLRVPKYFFGLHAGHSKIRKQPVLSEQVLVAEQREDLEWELSHRPFLFAPQFQVFVGSCLPMGVGPHRPAMVAAIRRLGETAWSIVACYTDMKYPQLLWREEKPDWVTGERRGTSKKKAG